ncbi:MAG: SDR family oxidoreductase [Deltaproteobacteria bacterium]|nr:SDR family oxidoreductase [Deltaproteobacteria bacterium]
MAKLTKLSRSIAGKAAIVTGAGSGIGRATAHLFAEEGAKVAVVDLNAQSVQTVVDEIVSAGYEAKGFACDVGDAAACKSLVGDVVTAFGRLDILVNNAGVSFPGGATTPEDEFEQSWQSTLAVNLTAHARLIRAALPHLQASGAGRVVNVASSEAFVATAGLAAYTATKHGVIGLTRSFAVEVGRTGVNVNCVCPGPIRTGMTAPIPDDVKDSYAKRRVPLRRYGEPEEVAHGILSLVLPASSYMNASVLLVDGGMTIRHP